MLSPNIGGLGLEFSKGGRKYLDRLPFSKHFRLSFVFQKKLGRLPSLKEMRSSYIFEIFRLSSIFEKIEVFYF